jgi:hypothetical protein
MKHTDGSSLVVFESSIAEFIWRKYGKSVKSYQCRRREPGIALTCSAKPRQLKHNCSLRLIFHAARKEGRKNKLRQSGPALNVIIVLALFAAGENNLSSSVRKLGHSKFEAGGRAGAGTPGAPGDSS